MMTKILVVILVSLFMAGSCFAQTDQWTKTSGPYGGSVSWTLGSKSCLLVCLSYNTLLRSTDTGDSWDTLSPPSTYMYGITGNDSTMILGTYTRGFLLSRNHGDSWEPISDLANIVHSAWGFSTSGGSHVLAVDDSIWLSTDDGGVWHSILFPIKYPSSIYLDGNILYCSGLDSSTNNWRLLRRAIDDTMWVQDALASSSQIQYMSRAGGMLYCNAGDVTYRRRDTLSLWDSVKVRITAAVGIGPRLVAVGTALLHSTDNGSTWMSTTSVSGFWSLCLTDDTVPIAARTGIFRTRNGGESWEPLAENLLKNSTTSILAGSNPHNVFAYVSGSELYRTTDIGQKWSRVGLSNSGFGYGSQSTIRSIAFDADTLYVARTGGLYRSEDDGSHFTQVMIAESVNTFTPLVVSCRFGKIIVSIGYQVYESGDHGRTWRMMYGDTLGTSISKICMVSPTELYVASKSILWHTIDAGDHWTRKTYPKAVSPGSIYGLGAIGTSVFLSGKARLISSQDSGATWHLVYDSLSTNFGMFQTLGKRIVFSDGISSSSLFVSDDSGKTLKRIPMGYGYKALRSLLVFDTLLIGGFTNNGVWTSTNSRLLGVDKATDRIPYGTPVLYANYPNPFNPQTTIRFSLPHSGPVRLVIYNVLGQKIATLVDEVVPAGEHVREWKPENIASGVYFSSLTAGGQTSVRKLLLAK